MRTSIILKAVFLCSCLTISNTAYAQFGGLGGSISNALGSVGSQPTTSPEDLQAGYSDLQTNFIDVFVNLLTAQSITAAALGSQEDADRYAAQATELGSGECTANCMDTTIAVSEEAMEKSNSLLSNADQLDEESSNILRSAVPYYLAGTASGVRLPGSFASWADQASSAVNAISSNPISAANNASLISDIPTVAQIAVAMPDVISTWLDATGNFANFANRNGIETADLESAASQQF